jgi:hypothetical protein
MQELAKDTFRLKKDVQKGDKESLQTLFDDAERLKHMEVLSHVEQDTTVRVVLEGIGEVDLEIGAELKKGQKKTIMTLFHYPVRATLFSVSKNAKAGQNVPLKIFVSS